MKKTKSIAVFTSIRSEYGLLTPLLARIVRHPHFELRLLVGGAHLLDSYGKTIDQIKRDGFTISEYFPFLSEEIEEDTYPLSLSKLQLQIGNYLQNNPVDLLLVLGDRFELIPVVATSLLLNIPIAHISGGEFTEGAIDNQIRHAITKMAHVHFPATAIYKDNLIKMGEEEWRICVSGEPGLDLIKEMNFISKHDLYNDLGLDQDQPVICCTFHPETINNKIKAEFVKDCLQTILAQTDYQIVTTASNFDLGGEEINEMLIKCSHLSNRIVHHKSLGQLKYYSLLSYADIVLGNSSSALVEAQSFNIPAINIGERQKGRLSNPNVMNCEAEPGLIVRAMKFVKTKKFKKNYFDKPNIYGDGTACNKIIEFLEVLKWDNLLVKRNTYR
ncbi:MAG: UDP-N-acetylglucosamine 2-epimerase [Chitinophagales bacterium]